MTKRTGKKKEDFPGENVCFEDALGKLEVIVNDLETGELNLEEALLRFEEGIALSRFCMQRLAEVETKIDLLLSEEQGKLVVRPLELGGDS